MSTTATKPIDTPNVLTAEQWLELETDISEPVLGSPEHCIVRPFTKNIIEAPEKAFKTTFTLRFTLGLSCGKTLFSQLPVFRSRRVLYIHGELSPPEIKERTQAAVVGLPRPLDNFFQGRDLRIHLGNKTGQNPLIAFVMTYKPEVVVLDPWQSFITGCDENSFEHISRVEHFLDTFIEDYKITLFIVTHTGKDRWRGTRGHSSLAGWRDTLFKLNRAKGQDLVEVTVDPRWASPVKPFNLKFQEGILVPTDPRHLTPQMDEIVKMAKKEGGVTTKKEVGAALGIKPESLSKALWRAQEKGVISIKGKEIRAVPDEE